MTDTNFFWALAWFVGGCFVFQIRGIKSFLDVASYLVSVFSLFALLTKPDPIAEIFISISLGYITGIFTFTIYRIGANISRWFQFNKMSPKIILYILSLPLWVLLELRF